MTATRAAAVLVAAAVFLLSWSLLHHGWFTKGRIVDTPVYESYGNAVADGRVPYRDFAVEYPPAALPAFVLPTLAQRHLGGSYDAWFDRLMALCGVLLVAVVAALRLSSHRDASNTVLLGVVAASPLLVGSLILSRFDLWPALLSAAALAALLAERDALGGALLGLGVAAKLYPALLVPLGIAWVWRRRGGAAAARWLALVAGVAAAIFLPFVALAPGGVAHSFATQLGRPLQVESLGAAVLMALHHGGLALHGSTTHGSQNLDGPLPDAFAAATTVAQALVVVAVWATFARGPMNRERLTIAAAGVVAAFVALGKVLSPQFLIWLVALVPLVGGRRGLVASGLLVVALVLTQTWFPRHYWPLALDYASPQSWLLLARDLVLVALAAFLAYATATGTDESHAASSLRSSSVS